MFIENPILATDNCRYCLMCRHVCPVGHVTRLETLTPHGWGLLIASQRRGLITWNDSSIDKLYSCADCGLCRSHCVTDQPLPDAIAAARAEVAAQGLAPASLYPLNEALLRWGNPYQPAEPQPPSGQGQVALFVGDEAHYLWPGALEAALALLKAVGVEPVLIGAGRNNGYIASSLGFPDTARRLAEANLADLQATNASTLLVLSPGDLFAFRQLYDERLGLGWPAGVKLQEVTVLLDERLAAGELTVSPRVMLRAAEASPSDVPTPRPFAEPQGDTMDSAVMLRAAEASPAYAYIDPAHTVRAPERMAAPRSLLAAVMPTPGVELFWRQERTHPAGSTSLKFANPQLADHLTYARLGDAAQAGARLLISEDPGTLHALSTHAARFGVQVQGLYELLAECLLTR
jgi:Fe-S oxidoreductase